MKKFMTIAIILLAYGSHIFAQTSGSGAAAPPTSPTNPAVLVPQAAKLFGHVVDRQHQALSNATLELYPDCDEPRDTCRKVLKSTTSGADGAYSIDEVGLTPGVYRLRAQLSAWLAKMKVPVNIPADNGKSFDFVLQPNRRDEVGRLSGISSEDAKEIFEAAKFDGDIPLEFLAAEVVADASTSPTEKQKFVGVAHTNLMLLKDVSFIDGTVVYPVAQIKAVNRLTGEEFRINPDAKGEFKVKVTGVGTYDFFSQNPVTGSKELLIKDITVEPDTKKHIYFAGTAGHGEGRRAH